MFALFNILVDTSAQFTVKKNVCIFDILSVIKESEFKNIFVVDKFNVHTYLLMGEKFDSRYLKRKHVAKVGHVMCIFFYSFIFVYVCKKNLIGLDY